MQFDFSTHPFWNKVFAFFPEALVIVSCRCLCTYSLNILYGYIHIDYFSFIHSKIFMVVLELSFLERLLFSHNSQNLFCKEGSILASKTCWYFLCSSVWDLETSDTKTHKNLKVPSYLQIKFCLQTKCFCLQTKCKVGKFSFNGDILLIVFLEILQYILLVMLSKNSSQLSDYTLCLSQTLHRAIFKTKIFAVIWIKTNKQLRLQYSWYFFKACSLFIDTL